MINLFSRPPTPPKSALPVIDLTDTELAAGTAKALIAAYNVMYDGAQPGADPICGRGNHGAMPCILRDDHRHHDLQFGTDGGHVNAEGWHRARAQIEQVQARQATQ